MKVHHLNCASMRPFGGRLVYTKGAREICCHVLLVEAPEGLVLVDAGLGLVDLRNAKQRLGRLFMSLARPALDEAETAIRQVEKLGYSPKDVRHIVLTHMDLDHVGGISDFPEAEIHVMRDELLAATRRATLLETERYRPIQWSHRPKLVAHEATGEPFHGFAAVRALPGVSPEILLVPLVGHTRGHAGVAVSTDRGWLFHAGDAYFSEGQIRPESPSCPPALSLFQSIIAMDDHDRLTNTERLAELARSKEVSVFSAHDVRELSPLVKGSKPV
ncbi:MAG: MBL fold metallo-hydrolase [Deltaproteobacteria bacterium]|nr:MBL fold metallo-hydrolase [Deltaproteobacteria bacterium]